MRPRCSLQQPRARPAFSSGLRQPAGAFLAGRCCPHPFARRHLTKKFVGSISTLSRSELKAVGCAAILVLCFTMSHGRETFGQMIRSGFWQNLVSVLLIAFLASLHAQAQVRPRGPNVSRPKTQALWQSPVPAPPQHSTARKTLFELDVPGNRQWTDSGIDLEADDRLLFTATGTLQYALGKENGPEGLPRGWKDLLRLLPMNDLGRGALIGRVGSSEAAEPFSIGSRREFQVVQGVRLFLGINQPSNEQAEGSFHVRVEIIPRAAQPPKPAPGGSGSPAASLTPALLDMIPRRVADRDGNPGDMVNFLILGSEAQMQQAFQSAGWMKVDRTKKDAVIHGILASISKQAYTQMPMSELYLFERPQDFGYAHAEPLAVVASRHHLRLWKAPFRAEGRTLWVGAATYDIGFERDERNGQLTHKIDPAIDLERDYVGESLNQTGAVAELTRVSPSHPVTEASTATGGSFHSDGKILVLSLTQSEKDRSGAFANPFCYFLGREHLDPGEWGECANYLEAPAPQRVAPTLTPVKYRLLITPGISGSCASSLPATALSRRPS